ncbi:unnamed protein product [Lathyrus oleraceus]
MNICR